ncbi:hypothetical protein C5167_032721 [Papaver somniferum]|uniref:Cytochrome P450 n=1 Tax=Papaver somniferum TaxID=3469 RepID=A0A4Y7K9R4_PAPSO|nr:hypothetical protein C5167_032721 [Papaver somniferum]
MMGSLKSCLAMDLLDSFHSTFVDSEKIEEEMHKSILKIINKREAKLKMGEVDGYGNDFLGSLIVAYHENKRITLEDLIDECKTFYDAGHETATALLTWTCLLLATHADWQEKARNEVIELLKEDQSQNLPTYENILPKLKTLSKFCNPTPHHDPEIWGEDVQLFKPERFSEGTLTATHNKFGFVPPDLEIVLIALTMILQKYSLTVSPGYVHSPIHGLVSCPQYGLQLTLHPIE